MRTNYILVDYENTQPESLAVLEQDFFRVKIFVGSNQTKIPFDFVESAQRLGDRAEYIKISGNGSNALDFHIAYYIGILSAEDPTAYFHIISKDTGFDPLIQHLKAKKIFISRSSDVTIIPAVKVANSKSAEEKIEVIIANLVQRGASKPGTVKTLSSSISSLFQKQLVDEEVEALLKILVERGLITIQDTKVSYHIS
ncbi:PIN domain-containing protein [Vitreoscilla filiformis]|uniref:PIN domain-containing protein n=1 Tax=Vitreoscilla filiformis TaxID=63 RepID=UPI000B79E917|nr:PIN domain-containing protein [Vitreoscilla filiformis]